MRYGSSLASALLGCALLAGLAAPSLALPPEPAPSCGQKGRVVYDKDTTLVDASGRKLARFSGGESAVSLLAPPAGGSDLARIETGTGRGSFRLAGFVKAAELRVYANYSLPVVSGHVSIAAGTREYDFRVSDPRNFLKEVAGTDHHFRLDEFADTMRSRLVSVFSEALAASKVPVLDVATRYSELGSALLPLINPVIGEKYGIEMTSFILENVSVPPEVEAAIDKRSSMAAVGNLNDYVKYQMAQGMAAGSGAGIGGAGAELAMGMAMAQQMMSQPGGIMAQTTPAAGATPAASGIPETIGPADAAKALGVSEAEVIASLEAGDLKGKKIGTQWRVTRTALAEFLK